MTRDELTNKLILNYPSVEHLSIVQLINLLSEEDPTFSFALREDLKDNKEFLPTRAEPKASGWDVRAAMPDRKPIVIKPFDYVKIPLGTRSFCPDGWWYELKPRSSTFAKKMLHPLYGTIDETYEGELVFACQYIPSLQYYVSNNIHPKSWEKYCETRLEIAFGDAIGQLIPVRRQEMKLVEWTNEEYDSNCKTRDGHRRDGGFGSTGK